MKFRITTFLFFMLSIHVASAVEIRMAVSDLLAEFIEPSLKSYAGENGLVLNFDSIGSLPAMERLQAEEIDIAIVAFPEGSEVPRQKFSLYAFAYDSAVIVVNGGNPVNEISLPRLAGIFGSSEEFSFSTWGELGLSGWRTRNIKPLAGPAEESISLELFRHSVLSGRTLKPSVAVLRDSEIEGAIASNINSIGILSSLPKNKNLKVLMLSEGPNRTAYGPTPENIHMGDYPIRLNFYIAYNPRDEEKVRPLVRALFSEEIAGVLSKNNLFPLPVTVRNQFLVDLNFRE
ncbi:MAG: PstS family phosphate ABC transporter substrate-binding protein [Opitutales bacterium]